MSPHANFYCAVRPVLEFKSFFPKENRSFTPISLAFVVLGIKSDPYKLFINLTLLGHVTENFDFHALQLARNPVHCVPAHVAQQAEALESERVHTTTPDDVWPGPLV